MSDQRLIEVDAPYNGTEVLRVISDTERFWTIVSVPVFAMGISRGTLVEATAAGTERLRLVRVAAVSAGATIRYIMAGDVPASTQLKHVISDSAKRVGLPLGPVTLFDPQIAAIHIPNRAQWEQYGTLGDELAVRGVIKFWELGDPDIHPEVTEEQTEEAWELVHPPTTGEVFQIL